MYEFLIKFILKVFGLLQDYDPRFTYRIEGYDDKHFYVFFTVDDEGDKT